MIVLNIQFWEGDKEQAMALARLIADLEPTYRDTPMLFTCRFDCTFDEETIAYCAKKFPVLRHKTKRKATGWPDGPNQMMGCSYEHLAILHRDGALPGIKGVMFIEADSVPLRVGWLDELIAEYRDCGKPILGAWVSRVPRCREHINGNCIIAIDFWKSHREIFHSDARIGWDVYFSHLMLANAAPSKLIFSDYRLNTPENPLNNPMDLWRPREYKDKSHPLYGWSVVPAWLHGVKGMEGLEAARWKLLPNIA